MLPAHLCGWHLSCDHTRFDPIPDGPLAVTIWLVISRFGDSNAADVDHSEIREEATPVLLFDPSIPAPSYDSGSVNRSD